LIVEASDKINLQDDATVTRQGLCKEKGDGRGLEIHMNL
jgi:hypothetical protein